MRLRKHLLVISLSVLATLVAAGLLLSPAGNPQSAEATLLSEVRKLLGSDPLDFSHFGWSAAVSGDTAVVGAPSVINGGGDAGVAYVFQRNQGGADNWGEVRKLLASDSADGDGFGISVAIDGDTAVVGADGPTAAYVYQRDEGGADNWGQVARLNGRSGSRFGVSVAVSGEVVVVGAENSSSGPGCCSRGTAYVYQRNQGGPDNWGEVKLLFASDADLDDQFGFSVAVSGDTAVVGAYREDADITCACGLAGSNVGAAYVFQRDQGGSDNWGEVTKLLASDYERGDHFGVSAAVSGDTAVVGADREDGETGAAYVFQRDEGGQDNWGEVTKLTASDAEPNARFGTSVALSADTALIGAALDNTGGADAGAAYVFRRDQAGPDNWGEVRKLAASDAELFDRFGTGVALSGDTAIVGAYSEDTGGADAGAAYVFEQLQPKPTPTTTPTPTVTPTPTITSAPTITPTKQPDPGDTDGDGCSDVRENGPDETLGGQRGYLNPWDFYDVLGPGAALPLDQIIDLPNDVLGVVQRFSPSGAAPYDVQFDRGPSTGPNPWNMTAPDGVIDLPNDILGVVLQFQHDCR